LPPADFESAASAIPPLGRAGKIYRAPPAWPPDAGLDSPAPTLESPAWPVNSPAVIEIPTNERNKYELDKQLGFYRLDRVLHSAVHYRRLRVPAPHPRRGRRSARRAGPHDHSRLHRLPGGRTSHRSVSPGGPRRRDEKVLAVPTGDPYSEGLSDLGDIPKHYLKEIEHFFQVYKDLEGTRTETRGFEGAAAARGDDPPQPTNPARTPADRGSLATRSRGGAARACTAGPRCGRRAPAVSACRTSGGRPW
jgi:inorganic pyrophosphatase